VHKRVRRSDSSWSNIIWWIFRPTDSSEMTPFSTIMTGGIVGRTQRTLLVSVWTIEEARYSFNNGKRWSPRRGGSTRIVSSRFRCHHGQRLMRDKGPMQLEQRWALSRLWANSNVWFKESSSFSSERWWTAEEARPFVKASRVSSSRYKSAVTSAKAQSLARPLRMHKNSEIDSSLPWRRLTSKCQA